MHILVYLVFMSCEKVKVPSIPKISFKFSSVFDSILYGIQKCDKAYYIISLVYFAFIIHILYYILT